MGRISYFLNTIFFIFFLGPAVEFEDFSLSSEEVLEIENDHPPQDFPPPLLGEHSREILKTILKFDDSRIQELVDEGVIEYPS